jgi:hypothetical protein
MRIALYGQLENALITALTREYNEEHRLPRNGGYYGSLFRYTESSCFERAGTLAAIASEVVLSPRLDWTLQSRDSVGTEDFGIKQPAFDPEDANPPTYELAELALKQNAFSDRSQAVLEAGGSERGAAARATSNEKAEFARMQLAQMIDQVLAAGESGAMLALVEDDRRILQELTTFVAAQRLGLPFDLPDMQSLSVLDDETIPSALVNLAPVDAGSILAARTDSLVQRYSAQVSQALAEADEIGRKRALVAAMREAAAEEGRITAATRILDVITSVVRALHVPIAGMVLGGVSAKLKSERTKRSWHLLSVRMSELRVRDYLARTDNL